MYYTYPITHTLDHTFLLHLPAQTKDEQVMATYYAHAGDYDMPWDPDVHFIMSDNFFKDFSTPVKCGNQFEIVGKYVVRMETLLPWLN